jgi:hypothetical protein
MTELRDELAYEAKRLIIDATYSSRGHFVQASNWQRWGVILGLPLAILSGLSAAGAAVTAIFTNFRALTAALALTSAVLTSVRGFLRPEESAEAHGVKAARYLGIRNDAQFFLRVDLKSDVDDAALTKSLRALRKTYNDLTLVSPHVVSTSAYQQAKKSIEQGEASYENDPLWADLDK